MEQMDESSVGDSCDGSIGGSSMWAGHGGVMIVAYNDTSVMV